MVSVTVVTEVPTACPGVATAEARRSVPSSSMDTASGAVAPVGAATVTVGALL